MTAELACRLRHDATARKRFHKSFGLDPEMFPDLIDRVSEFLPDTPVKLLRDVFMELQLYDLAEMLEKITPRTLRPSLSLKEMKMLPNERPTKDFSKAEVLLIEHSDGEAAVDAQPDFDRIGSFFQALNARSQVTKKTVIVAELKIGLVKQLEDLKNRKASEEQTDSMAKDEEKELKELLEQKVPQSPVQEYAHGERLGIDTDLSKDDYFKQRLNKFYEEEPAMTKRLEDMMEERRQRRVKIEKIEKEMIQLEKELQEGVRRETEKFQMAVSTVMDKWIRQANDKGEVSKLTRF